MLYRFHEGLVELRIEVELLVSEVESRIGRYPCYRTFLHAHHSHLILKLAVPVHREVLRIHSHRGGLAFKNPEVLLGMLRAVLVEESVGRYPEVVMLGVSGYPVTCRVFPYLGSCPGSEHRHHRRLHVMSKLHSLI